MSGWHTRPMPPSLSRILDARGATRVRIAPDGAWLCYVTDITGTPQLWRVATGGGMPRRITFDCDRVGAYRISPDGARIAYGADSGGNERWQLWVMDADGTSAHRLSDRDDRIHHLGAWTHDGRALLAYTNVRDERYFDVWTHPADGGEPRMLYRHDGTVSGLTALADGGAVLTVNRRRSDENHLLLISADGAARTLTPDEPMGMYAVAGEVPGGLVVRARIERDFEGLATLSYDGRLEWLVTPHHDVEDAVVSGHRDAYAVNVGGFTELHLRDVASDVVLAGLPAGTFPVDLVGDPMALEGDTIAVSWARYDVPGTIYVRRRDEDWRELVPPVTAGLAHDDLPDTRLVKWPTFDGREIPGFLLTPRAAGDAPRPTIIDVHGGPEGQSRPSWNPRTAMFVANGFNVLLPNVRGSTGYGKTYQSLDDVEKRLDSVRDLDAAAAWLVSSGVAPKDKIGVIGQSYGGYMVLAAVAFFPDREWAAAVDVYGIANFLSFFEHTAAWRRPLRAVEYGDPVKDRELLVSISPITRLDAIRAPMLFIHGANDPRVPIVETEQMVAALRAKGREIEYLRYEDEGHSLAKAKNRADAYPKVLAFFQRHMGASPAREDSR